MHGLDIRPTGALDFVSLGALVHRLDPGIVPFRKATECQIHVSGGEFNVAANLADCFGLKTGIATAMVDYPIGDLIAERVRAMGVRPFYKRFPHNGVNGPNMATVYSDRGHGVRAPVVFYNRSNEAAARLKPGDFDWAAIFAGGVRWFHSGGIFAALSETTGELIIEGDEGGPGGGRRRVVRPQLPREALEHLGRPGRARSRSSRASWSTWTCWSATRRTCRRGSAFRARRWRPRSKLDPAAFFGMIDGCRGEAPAGQGGGHDAARGALDQPPQLGRGGLGRTGRPTRRRRVSSTCWTASAAATGSRRASSTGCWPANRRRRP